MIPVLSIAGFDPSGGAGILADIKTITAHGLYGMSLITALTDQNTLGVKSVTPVEDGLFASQLDTVLSDIKPRAVKVGMVASHGQALAIAKAIECYRLENIVLDPVLISTSGKTLTDEATLEKMKESLLPKVSLLTPNIPEAESLSGREIKDKESQKAAAQDIFEKYGCQVLVKGGHGLETGSVCDYLWDGREGIFYEGIRVNNPNNHGTGCALSSAIACNLACFSSMEGAILSAKTYLQGALEAKLALGQGNGPMDLAFAVDPEQMIRSVKNYPRMTWDFKGENEE